MKKQILENYRNGIWSFSLIVNKFKGELPVQVDSKTDFLLSDQCFSFYNNGINKKHFFIKNKIVNEVSNELNYFLEKNNLGLYSKNNGNDAENMINEALMHMSVFNDVAFSNFSNYIDGIAYIKNGDFYGFSHPHCFGIIFVGEKFLKASIQNKVISIIHEMAHQELFLVNLTDRLVNQQFDFNFRFAPFQRVDRPPIGRLHSLVAMYRMLQAEIELGCDNLNMKKIFFDNIEAFNENELTSFGHQIVSGVNKWSISNYL